jgi:hypothetical protein
MSSVREKVLSKIDTSQIHRFRKYFTYIVIFPNGQEWIKQEPLVHDLEWHLHQMAREHKDEWDWKHYLNDLFKKREASWRDRLGIRHIIKIETTKRNTVWGAKPGEKLSTSEFIK